MTFGHIHPINLVDLKLLLSDNSDEVTQWMGTLFQCLVTGKRRS